MGPATPILMVSPPFLSHPKKEETEKNKKNRENNKFKLFFIFAL
jgi:hypothetical protein